MKSKAAKICIAAGIVCIIGALSLFLYNIYTSHKAGVLSQKAVNGIKEAISSSRSVNNGSESGGNKSAGSSGNDSAETSSEESKDGEKSTVTVNGEEYVGYISIPSLALELPVMAQWSYEKLNVSSCRYSGSVETDDLVIAAHNYSSHFGFISKLAAGDRVSFIDINGIQTDYGVVLSDTLSPASVSDMTAGEYDLTLFTCTETGLARVTVRLNKAS